MSNKKAEKAEQQANKVDTSQASTKPSAQEHAQELQDINLQQEGNLKSKKETEPLDEGHEIYESEKIKQMQENIIELEATKKDLNEALLRKQADFENYRRRMQKEKQDAIQFSNRNLISGLLEVLDSFERALASHQNEKDSSPAMKDLFEGLELLEKQLVDMLCTGWGLKMIDSVGQEFDPNFHEALTMEENPDYKVPTVVKNFQTGYTLHGRILRPARVKVAKPSE